MGTIIFLLIILVPISFIIVATIFLNRFFTPGLDYPYWTVDLNNNLNQFLVYDASFVEEEFLDFTRKFYQEYRDCIQYKDTEKLRTMLSGALYSQLETQIDELRRKGHTLHTGRIKFGDVTITGWRHEKTRDVLPVAMKAEHCVFTTDDVTDEVIDGDKAIPEILDLTLEFVRATYTRSVDFLEKEQITCPKCGAKYSVEQEGECPYCGNVIKSDKFDWILSNISINPLCLPAEEK